MKRYLELYEGAFLLFSIFKYAKNARNIKSSSPKLILGCPALANLALGTDYVRSAESSGRVFESALGMELLRLPDAQVYWWRDGHHEVDFVVRRVKTIYALEVKSGRRRRAGGLEAFLKVEPNAMPSFITKENFASFAKSPGKFLDARN